MVAFPDALLLDVTGPLQVFGSANQMLNRTHYDIGIATQNGEPVKTGVGVTLSADLSFDDVPAVGDLIVPGGPGVDAVLDNDILLEYLRQAAQDQNRIISVCSGSMLLAQAGLLDGKEATSHWSRIPELRDRYPDVQWNPDAIFTRDGRTYCSAGVTAGIDLALALVEDDLGRALALEVARELVVYMRRSGGQSQYSRPLRAEAAVSSSIRGLCSAIAQDPTRDWRVSSMSAFANMTERSLHRHFVREFGETPSRYVEGTRLDLARSFLDHDGRNLEEVSYLSGFGSAQNLRRAFEKLLGVTPNDYRDRFGDHNSLRPPRGRPA